GCSTTIIADIIPLNVNVNGHAFNGSDVLNATLASPIFKNADYTTTPRVTSTGPSTLDEPGYTAGGPLSAGNVGVQLEDATMRSQFNKTGSSPYHLILRPVVHPAIALSSPPERQAKVVQSIRGVSYARVDEAWWDPQIE